MVTVRSSGDGKVAMIRGFGERRAGVEGKVGEFLNLLGLSASTEDEETAGKAGTDKDQDEECDKKSHHGWGQSSSCCAVRAISDNKLGDDGHCWLR